MSFPARAFLAIVLAGATGSAAAGWPESRFEEPPLVAHPISPPGGARPERTVVGRPLDYVFSKGDTLWDVARALGLGINEVTDALPDVDEWVPPTGEARRFPAWWVLPRAPYEGIVVNIPEMRLYYFRNFEGGDPMVLTYPVGLGRIDWKTPVGSFRIIEKTVDPTWVIPESIREERAREKGRHERQIPGGHPENPLGRYRLRLSIPEYAIHGTNIPWGVGMHVSHGCLRMYPEDVERFFGLVETGSPGRIVYEPVKVGARDGVIFVEAHRDVYETDADFEVLAARLLGDRGWQDAVDDLLLERALKQRRGVPEPVGRVPSTPPKRATAPLATASFGDAPEVSR